MEQTLSQTFAKRINGRFENRWDEWPFGYLDGPYRLIKWLASLVRISYSRPNLEKDLPIKSPYFVNKKLQQPKDQEESDSQNKIRATWLGHASVLVEIDQFTVLCDPVFSDRCPPKVGPQRYREAPCEINELPHIDAVLISHNHYDHMDSDTIRQLSILYPRIKWFVPMGDKKTILSMIKNKSPPDVREMMWWDEVEFTKPKNSLPLKIVFTPTQHWSNRGVFDSFKSLWGSWAMIGPCHSFWFGGDTGYCKSFKEIGNHFGSFDGAAIPIGAYKPRELTKFQHVEPSEAILIHKDIKSAISFGIHWGTFQLTEEPYLEPKEILEKEVAKESDVKFITINHGETIEIIGKDYKILSGPDKPTDSKSSSSSLLSSFYWFMSPFYWLLSIISYNVNFLCSRKRSTMEEGILMDENTIPDSKL